MNQAISALWCLKWTTAEELGFIERLGRWSEKGSKSTRAEALSGYLKGASLRQNWGGVDWCRCIARAETLLSEVNGVQHRFS